MNNLDLEIQTLDEERQMRNLANAIQLADGFSLLFVRCNQRPRQKEIIEELRGKLDGCNIKVIFLDHQIEHLLDELQKQIGDKQYDAIFVYGLESSFPKADEAAESPFVVTLNHARNSFKKVLNCPLVLFLPEYALSAIYHGATDFYSIRSGVYLFSAKAEETEQLITKHTSQTLTELETLLFEERQNQIKTVLELITEYKVLPDSFRDKERENSLKEKLAKLYYISGEYLLSSNIHKEIIAYARKSKNLVLLAKNLNGLGLAYKELGKYNEAVNLFRESINIAQQIFGVNHPDYATCLNNLALVYRSQGKYNEAMKLYKKSIDIDGKSLGTNHPLYAGDLNNLASIYQAQGNYDEAALLYTKALHIDEENFGTDHINYAVRLNNLAGVYFEQEKYQDAVKMYKETCQIFKRILGKKHPHTRHTENAIDICQTKIKEQSSRLVPYKN